MSPLYYVFRVRDTDELYLQKYFDSRYWHRFMILNGDTGARSDRFAIKDSTFTEMPIPYPELDEQRKIGEFLNQLENTINLHQENNQKLGSLKKDLLVKMIPGRESQYPTLRFLNFHNQWKDEYLKNMIKAEIKGKAKSNMAGGDTIYLDTEYLNGGPKTFVSSIKDVTKDDVLILWDGSKAGTVYHGFEGALGSTLKAYKPVGPGAFIFQQLLKHQEKIYVKYRTPNIPHVIRNFTNIFILKSTSHEEQMKVSNSLLRIDRLVELNEEKIKKLKFLKQEYLRKLFI